MAESLRQVLCFQVGHDRRDSDSGKRRYRSWYWEEPYRFPELTRHLEQC